jgi:ABC-type uncharacterized transport system permease subunit
VLETFQKNHRPLAEVSWQRTARYYVDTFHLQLVNAFALILALLLIAKVKVRLQIDSGSGSPLALLPFEPQNTKLPDVLFLTPYFKSTSES